MNSNIKVLNHFVKEVKKLFKKYKNIHSDLKNLQNELLANPRKGVDLGNHCYKIRMVNSSVPTGKSGGFRVIYYYLDTNNVVYLMSIYTKSDLQNISDEAILEIMKENGIN